MPSCDANDSGFNEPLLWIGLFVSMSSFSLFITLSIHAFHAIRHRLFFFPAHYYIHRLFSFPEHYYLHRLLSLPGCLLLLADLNTYMPSHQDQLLKLSTTALMCVAIGNFMPSLGAFADSHGAWNVSSLSSLLASVLISAAIQIRTGVIYAFLPEHILILIFLSVQLLILGSTALVLPAVKPALQKQCEFHVKTYRQLAALREAKDVFCVEKVKEFVKRNWMVSQACNPEYFLSCSPTCSTSGAIGVLGALVFTVASLRSIFLKSFCHGVSYYKWSTTWVLIFHSAAVLVGAVAPAFRWFHAISLNRNSGLRQLTNELRVEDYWVERLVEWKERPLYLPICSASCRKLALWLKMAIMNVCLLLQRTLVWTTKFVFLIASQVKCMSCLGGHGGLHDNSATFNQRNSASDGLNPDINNFVSHILGVREAVPSIFGCQCMDGQQWIDRGSKNKPSHLMELLRKSTISEGFGVFRLFDFGRDVPSLLGDHEPPNSWALPLVTLTSITTAIAYSSGRHDSISPLITGVNEGLKLVRVIEKMLDDRQTKKGQDAADVIWMDIELYKCWIDVDLHKFATGERNPITILQNLADVARVRVEEENMAIPTTGQKRPAKFLAANCMYRSSSAILQHFENKDLTAVEISEWLQITIADILGACLTNIPGIVSMQCGHIAIESRSERARMAACLLGEAEDVIAFLANLPSIADLDIEKIPHIDEWRSKNVKKGEMDVERQNVLCGSLIKPY